MDSNTTEKTIERVSFNPSEYTKQQLNDILKSERKTIKKARRLRKFKQLPKVPDFIKNF